MESSDLIMCISPFEQPDAALVASVCRIGALGVLDLGRDRVLALDALKTTIADLGASSREFGVRVPRGAPYTVADLAAAVTAVVLAAGADVAPWRARPAGATRVVLVQVTSVGEARAALAAGADGLIAKGNESGGRVGEETSFVLLQHIVAALGQEVPIWVQGGIGLHTAAACVAGGARGVVLDAQLALVEESSLAPSIRDVVRAVDSTDTVVVAGHRILVRHGLAAPPKAAAPAEIEARLGARDLSSDLLPAGQDVGLARTLAERYKTAAGVVRAVTRAVTGHLRQARQLDPLAPRSPFAVEAGLHYPVVQGPMTRVSDGVAFAEAVAKAGGLPFLALSLMRGAEARRLLAETKAAHERLGKPWGVGILGFVPPELREEQLSVLREIHPPMVLIAGGRPSQSRPLEEAGIPTFLHVPSPELLDLFLADGARRFILEGRECGGHVGPRSSFVLWEGAIDRLLASPHVGEVSVLFAGGIHDARSAAAVAGAAAPLAACGARIGVLLGTAYLFTEEAVSTGAILRRFQDVAIACDATVLVDSAPGHATRCAQTDYVRAFSGERERLEREGKSGEELLQALEQFNLGRLRIAAKGLARQPAGLTPVDDATQQREGMYMLGQVAALRSGTCTMAELHRDVSEGGGPLLSAAVERLSGLMTSGSGATSGDAGSRPRGPTNVAIVGMAAIFPRAPDVAAYWRNLLNATPAVTEVPRERWNVDLYYDRDGTGDKTPSRWGGFLPEVPFEPAAYGIPPRSLAAIEPVQLLALEVTRRALDDAGYGSTRAFDRGRASVIFGAEAGTDLSNAYGFRALYRQLLGDLPPELDAVLPRLTEDSFPGVLSNVIAGRIANRLDFGGVNYTVDAACASSLAAVDLACKELSAGTSDLVVCGGADLHNGINDYLMFASAHALSPTGQCRPFDAAADGTVLGEGVAVLVLKRLADAERDHDRIYAVIKGIGGSSDGKSLGLTAPRQEGQMRALERAYASAGISPADVELVEAHGTGTVVGDRTELATLTEVFAGAGTLPGRVTLGSVKSLLGHTKCAAGLAGLIKAALAIHHRVLPPAGNMKQPNPAYVSASSPFSFRDTAHPWPSERRIAGVSAFGFGGTNFHVVIGAPDPGDAASASAGEHSPLAIGLTDWPAELFLIRGASLREAQETCARIEALVSSGKPYRLRDLAAGVTQGPVQIAFVAESLDDLGAKCRAAGAGRGPGIHFAGDQAQLRGGAVAMLFPGQGSQRPGMHAELMVTFPSMQEALQRERRWADRIYPPAAFTPEERAAQAALLTDTRVAQPALGIVDLAMERLLAQLGVTGAMLGGHSYGELVALTVAGAIERSDLLALSEARAHCILEAAAGAPGRMAAVRATAEAIERALGDDQGGVVLANRNAPDQVVIAGPDQAVEAACARLAAAGLDCSQLPVACAFHSPVVAHAAIAFARRLEEVTVHAPARPVYSNSTAAPYPAEPNEIRALLAEQIGKPVRFADQIVAMYEAGARIFVEAGPGSVLTNLVRRILAERPHLAVACDRPGEPGLRAFLQALAALAAVGVDVDSAPLFAGRDVHPIDPAAPPAVEPPAGAWLVNGQRARPVAGELPDFAMKPVLTPVMVTRGRLPGAPAADREATVLEYLRGMREIVEGQKLVMLRHLGEPVAIEDAAAPAHGDATREASVIKEAAESPAVPTEPARGQSPLEVLMGIVSDRTGYTKEMLDLDLDIEANLGIDSIKRIEILGALSERLGFSPASDGQRAAMIEELSGVKTLRGISTWFEKKAPAAPAAVPAAMSTPAATSAKAPVSRENGAKEAVGAGLDAEHNRNGSGLMRYVLAIEPIPPAVPAAISLGGRRFAVTDDGCGIASRLATSLSERGAAVRVIAGTGDESLGTVDGLIHLAPLAARPAADPCKVLFALGKEAVLSGATWLLAATGLGGTFGYAPDGATPATAGDGARPAAPGAGIAGLLKSVAKEWPSLRTRSVDVELADGASAETLDRIAAALLAELLSDDSPVEVGYKNGGRYALRPVRAATGGDAGNGRKCPLEFGPQSVLLMTGGARGITAAAAIAIAERFGCSLELVGRSPLPEREEPDPELEACADAPALRRLLATRAGNGVGSAAEIEAQVTRLLAAREIRRTLASLERTVGSRLRYHAVDVRDRGAFSTLLDEIYARHGRLDGVIHGAGVIEDRLLRDKSRESFDRVFDTKVQGALTLLEKVRPDLGLAVFFSSISGVFGNRGQTDYAAANDALDKLALKLSQRIAGRVVSINWGPWAGTGMLSPELARVYEQRGIRLVRPEEGVTHLLDEILHGTAAQVILASATLERLAGQTV